MSRFTAKIKRLNALSGKIQEKARRIKARILPDSTIPKAEITPVKYHGGKWYKRISFGGIIRAVDVFYRMLCSRIATWLGVEAKAGAAQAKTVEIDSGVSASVEAPLASTEAAEIKIDHPARISRRAVLVSYYRAAVVYISKILTGRYAKLSSAPGAGTKYEEEFQLVRRSEAEAADSAIVESKHNRFTAESEAAGSAADSEPVETETEFTAESNATADAVDGKEANIQTMTGTASGAKMYAWFFAEQNGNELKLFQAFSGIQSGDVLEIDLEAESAYWANATVMDGTLNLVFAQTEPQTNNELKVI